MAKLELKITIYPDPILRTKAVPFTEEQINSPLVKEIAEEMTRLMYEYKGVGLAAQQAGIPNSICVIDPHWHKTDKKEPMVLINPEIIKGEWPAIELERPGEGCLSIPYSFRRPIPRHKAVEVSYIDLEGACHTKRFEDYEAIIIQHEIDHLHGHLFPDRLSRLQQDMFKRRVRKIRRLYRKGLKTGLRRVELQARSMRRLEKARERRQNMLDAWALRESKKEWGQK